MSSVFDEFKDKVGIVHHIEPLIKDHFEARMAEIAKLPLDYRMQEIHGFMLASSAISLKRIADAMDKLVAKETKT